MSTRFFQAASVAVFLVVGTQTVQAEPSEPSAQEQAPPLRSQENPPSRGLEAPDGAKSTTTCPGLHDQVEKIVAPTALIVDGPLPGRKQEHVPTESEVKCVESLSAAGRKDIEEGKLAQGTVKFLTAVQVALPLAWATYRDLAAALDKAAYPDPAIAAYRKAWAALEIEYERPETKFEGVTVIAMAAIRDAIVRLGGQAPVPTSELGRIVSATSTRKLQEQYFERARTAPPVK